MFGKTTKALQQEIESLKSQLQQAVKANDYWQREENRFRAVVREVNGIKVRGYSGGYSLDSNLYGYSYVVSARIEIAPVVEPSTYFDSLQALTNLLEKQNTEKAERERIAKIAREECYAAPKTKKKAGK